MSFSDIEIRILEKIDELSANIRDLCNRQTKTETQLNEHFRQIEEKRLNNNRKFYVIMALMTLGFTIYEVTRGLYG